MWNPGFAFVEQIARACIFGYRRSLCVRSWVHRGTRGTARAWCSASTVAAPAAAWPFGSRRADRDAVLDYLRERELVTNVYLERIVPIRLADGRRVTGGGLCGRPRTIGNMPARSIALTAAAHRRRLRRPVRAERCLCVQYARPSARDWAFAILAGRASMARCCGCEALPELSRWLCGCTPRSSASRFDGRRRQRQMRIASDGFEQQLVAGRLRHLDQVGEEGVRIHARLDRRQDAHLEMAGIAQEACGAARTGRDAWRPARPARSRSR